MFLRDKSYSVWCDQTKQHQTRERTWNVFTWRFKWWCDGIVFRRTRYLSILALNLLILLGDGGEEGVAAEEGDEPDDGEVVHGLEHVQLQPEEQVQQENGAQSQVESWKEREWVNKPGVP